MIPNSARPGHIEPSGALQMKRPIKQASGPFHLLRLASYDAESPCPLLRGLEDSKARVRLGQLSLIDDPEKASRCCSAKQLHPRIDERLVEEPAAHEVRGCDADSDS